MSVREIVLQIHPSFRTTLSFNDQILTINQYTKSTLHTDIPLRHVLKAQFDHASKTLTIGYVSERDNGKPSRLVFVEGQVEDSEVAVAAVWAEGLMKVAYEDAGIKRSRRLMVVVNPHSGKKRGTSIFSQKVEPILRTAGCTFELIYTTHQGHACEVAKSLPLAFDAVVTLSGDGLIHEIFNGFAQHSHPMKAFAIPVSPIPTGTGNGLALNLLGIEDGFDVSLAALNAVKGQPMKVDLFSFTQGEKRAMSFMSQALGMMADLDIGTEHLRWMGESRFRYGLMKGILQYKPCPVQLSFKMVENDKYKMTELYQTQKANGLKSLDPTPPSLVPSEESVVASLPPLKYLRDQEEGWTTFDEPILYVYAGKGPYVGRDFMAFPVSLPNDGMIDIMAMQRSSRVDFISAFDGAAEGKGFWHPKMHYVKAHAYRVKPSKKQGYLSVDGEPFPFEEFQVEVHQKLGTVLSLYGYYVAQPFTPKTGGSTHRNQAQKAMKTNVDKEEVFSTFKVGQE